MDETNYCKEAPPSIGAQISFSNQAENPNKLIRFDACPLEEQVRRLREELLKTKYTLEQYVCMFNNLTQTIDKLRYHRHDLAGQVLVDINHTVPYLGDGLHNSHKKHSLLD